jgi:hypothetical protein
MDFVSLEGSSVRIDASELDIFTQIVPPLLTQETFVARNTRLNRDSITYEIRNFSTLFRMELMYLFELTWFQIRNAVATFKDNSSSLVT